MQNHGTYWSSWNWFEARIYRPSLENWVEFKDFCNYIQHNVHASRIYKTHTITWDREDPQLGEYPRKYFDELRAGDWVQLVPKAEFPGWENHIRGGSIRLYLEKS